MREINRMKRWPAQVVTYKYGADVFKRAGNRIGTGKLVKADIRDFHDAAIAYGAMPLATFEDLLPEIVLHSRQVNKD